MTDYQRKCRWLTWTVVVLAILNISTVVTIFYHKKNAGSGNETISSKNRIEADAQNFSGRYFRDRLSLNASQMEQFREFNPTFRQAAKNITMELSRIRKEMLDEMASDADTARLNLLSDSIGILHAQLKKLTFVYYLNLKNISTPEQQKLLKEMFSEVFINDIPLGHPGQGPHGRQLGRKKMN